MEWVALDLGAGDRGVEEPEVKGGVVAHEYRAPAAVRAHGVADLAEYALQRIAFRQRRPQRVMRVDARDRQCHRVEAAAFEGLYVEGVGGATAQRAVGVHVDEHGGDLEQGIGRAVEATGLHVDRHGQIAAEAACHQSRGRRGRHGCRFGWLGGAQAAAPADSRQPMRSPARSGTSVSLPNGKLAGTSHGSCTRVMLPVLRGRP